MPLILLMWGLIGLVWGAVPAWAQADLGMLKKGVVKVTAHFSRTDQVGTGFIVGQGRRHLFIVTASHVIEGETEAPKSIDVTFFTHQEEAMPAEVVKKEGGDPRGLALLKVGGDLPEDVQVLEWDPQSRFHGGERVQLIGFPRMHGTDWAVTEGTVSGFDGPILKFSGGVEEGSSGGPLLYGGKVIGVVMEITGNFGNAKPSQIAMFTIENWPGFPPSAKIALPGEREAPRVDPSKEVPVGSPAPSGEVDHTMASLVVSTTPKDAEVFIDDDPVGRTSQGSLVLNRMVPDEYEVMVKKKGYRPWFQTVELLPGERRDVTVKLVEGAPLTVSGVWQNPEQPTLTYVMEQTGERVTMKEVTTSFLGTMITAEGEGHLQGNQLQLFYRTVLGTMGQSTAMLSDDGRRLSGTYQDFSNMIPMALSLVRTGDAPGGSELMDSEAWQAIQELGR